MRSKHFQTKYFEKTIFRRKVYLYPHTLDGEHEYIHNRVYQIPSEAIPKQMENNLMR